MVVGAGKPGECQYQCQYQFECEYQVLPDKQAFNGQRMDKRNHFGIIMQRQQQTARPRRWEHNVKTLPQWEWACARAGWRQCRQTGCGRWPIRGREALRGDADADCAAARLEKRKNTGQLTATGFHLASVGFLQRVRAGVLCRASERVLERRRASELSADPSFTVLPTRKYNSQPIITDTEWSLHVPTLKHKRKWGYECPLVPN